MDDLALLAQSDLFSTLDQDALRLMLTGARTVRCGRNNQLFSEGDEAEELYVVRSGRVAIAKRSSDGRESVLALMESGDLFVVDDFAQADRIRVVGRNHQREVGMREAQHQILTVLT